MDTDLQNIQTIPTKESSVFSEYESLRGRVNAFGLRNDGFLERVPYFSRKLIDKAEIRIATYTNYSEHLANVLWVVSRLRQGQQAPTSLPKLSQVLNDAMVDLGNTELNPDVEDKAFYNILEVLFLLVHQHSRPDIDFDILKIIALLHADKEGQIRHLNRCSKMVAGMMYWCRSVVLWKMVETGDEGYGKFAGVKVNCPFALLTSLERHITNFDEAEKRAAPLFTWVLGNGLPLSQLMINGEVFDIHQLGNGYRKCISYLKERILHSRMGYGRKLPLLKDNYVTQEEGYSAARDDQNPMKEIRTEFVQHISAKLKVNGAWHFGNVRVWIRYAEESIDALYWALTVNLGSHPRLTEYLLLRLVNGVGLDNRRNIYSASCGRCLVRTSKGKTNNRFGIYNMQERFTDHALAEVIFDTIHLIRACIPYFREVLGQPPMDEYGTYLFVRDGRVLTEDTMYASFKRNSQEFLGRAFGVRAMRQILKAVFDMHVRVFSGERQGDMMMGHTIRTGETRYAVTTNTPEGCSTATYLVRLKTSMDWHSFLMNEPVPDVFRGTGKDILLEAHSMIPMKRRHSGGEDECAVNANMSKYVETSPIFLDYDIPANDVAGYVQALRQILGEPKAVFRSKEQLRATALMHAFKGPMFIILPTGSGKTLTYLTAAATETGRVTVIIVFTVSLHGDLQRRFQNWDLKFTVWSKSHEVAPIMLLSYEEALTESYINLARHLASQGTLRRQIFEEGHQGEEWKRFRTSDLIRLFTIDTSNVFVTGTASPTLIHETGKTLGVEFMVYRCSSARPEIAITLHPTASISRAAKLVSDELDEAFSSQMGSDPWYVFCMTKSDIAAVAQELKENTNLSVSIYYGDMERGLKDEVNQQWFRNEIDVLVCTSAHGSGIDKDQLGGVFVLGPGHAISDITQKFGRAGRNRTPVNVHAIPLYGEHYRQDPEVNVWVNGGSCLPGLLLKYNDGQWQGSCIENTHWEACSVCRPKIEAMVRILLCLKRSFFKQSH